MEPPSDYTPSCPMPIGDYPNVLLAHGGGGKLTRQLIEQLFIPTFESKPLEERHDGAVLELGGERLAFTTDSYVVRPLFFAGGDIGSLAVNGTINDLAMCGARPMALSCGFIVEEGLPMTTLAAVAESMHRAASAVGVQLVTGDTKVVDRGKGDGLYLNTAGIGRVLSERPIRPTAIRPGDALLLSGDIGRHGIAIMAEREGLEFEAPIQSDCAPLWPMVEQLLAAGIDIHCLRDLTRGGLAASLIEVAETAAMTIRIEENAIPVGDSVQGACELLGLDPLFVANEGRLAAWVPAADADRALEIMRRAPHGEGACLIGRVEGDAAETQAGRVLMTSAIGTTRVLDLFSGEQLPRIC